MREFAFQLLTVARALSVVFATGLFSCASSQGQSESAFAQREVDEQKDREEAERRDRERSAHVSLELQRLAERRASDEAPREAPTFPNATASQTDPVGDWLRAAPSECSFRLNLTTCSNPPVGATPEQVSECKATCSQAAEAAAGKKVSDALDLCVAGDLATPPTLAVCKFEFPPGAGAGDPGKFAAAIPEIEKRCSKTCAEQRLEVQRESKERGKASAQGEQSVLSYKRCMLAVDRTTTAISYRIHDRDLYENLMQTANSRCRASNRCDWLESYSEFQCVYGD